MLVSEFGIAKHLQIQNHFSQGQGFGQSHTGTGAPSG